QLTHRGKLFSTVISLIDIAAGAKFTYSFTPSAGVYVHLKNVTVNAYGATLRLRFLKNASVTDPGLTTLTANNFNDNSSNSSQVVIKDSPSYTGGDIWLELAVGGSTSNQATIGDIISHVIGAELILKPSTTYIVEFENISSTDTAEYAIIYLIWAELTEGLTQDENV
ncbi:MAG: hypothetical protein ACTSRL_22360, partial [Candidatus Helarchaeota archaeon]